MLKRFSVENFSSFHGEQTLDMTSRPKDRTHSENYYEFCDVNLLKTAVIYGANASGKSNIIKAIDFSASVILKGIHSLDTYKKHFRLNSKSIDTPSEFEFELEVDNKFFSYGFSCLLKNKFIVEEWLYEIGNFAPKKIFSRNAADIVLGSSFNGHSESTRFKIYCEDMKHQSSQLFLTEIAEKELDLDGAKIFNKIYKWFDDKLTIVYPTDKLIGMRSVDQNLANLLSKYLCKFDTGIDSIDMIEEDFESSFKRIPSQIKADLENSLSKPEVTQVVVQGIGEKPQFLTVYKDENGTIKVKKLGFIHGSNNNDPFELEDESDGTRRLLDFVPLISRFDEESTILIDEFDRSLHPNLTKEFLKLFRKYKGTKSQLVLTSHESTLLDLADMRKDEIWLVDKNPEGASQLLSFAQFKVRYDKKIEKDYLLGRYGAIPIFKDFESFQNKDFEE